MQITTLFQCSPENQINVQCPVTENPGISVIYYTTDELIKGINILGAYCLSTIIRQIERCPGVVLQSLRTIGYSVK